MKEHVIAEPAIPDLSPEDTAMSGWIDDSSVYVRLQNDEDAVDETAD